MYKYTRIASTSENSTDWVGGVIVGRQECLSVENDDCLVCASKLVAAQQGVDLNSMFASAVYIVFL